MKWEKRGLVYVPTGQSLWAKTHAYLPTAHLISEDRIRVYFASLDENQFGRIAFIELDSHTLSVLCVTQEPVLDLGEPGTFDDSGVTPSCVLNVGTQQYMYYIGWQRTERVPYLLFCGLAIGDGKQLHQHSRVPILERTATEPFVRSATTILSESDFFRMWYVSALDWIQIQGRPFPKYIIRNAVSKDGIVWQSQPGICINFESKDEFGFGRPWVIKDGSLYKMWYSIRSRSHPYYLGYAESMDGITWQRKDEQVGISTSDCGWDSEMICFPCVIDVGKRRLMFYNGNRHGETGFGVAELIQD